MRPKCATVLSTKGPTIRLDANVATHRHRLGACRHTLRDHSLQHVQAPGG